MTPRMTVVGPRCAAVVGACVLLAAAPAPASTVSVDPTPGSGGWLVRYVAAAGEANDVTASGAINNYGAVIESAAAGITIIPRPPCIAGSGGGLPTPSREATCTWGGIELMVAELGDQDDSFVASTLPVVVFGGSGRDALSGSSSDDELFGEDGPDVLQGWQGDDVLDGGPGPDEIFGDARGTPSHDPNFFDVVDYSDRDAAVTVTLDGRADDGEAGEGDNVSSDVEDVLGGSGADTIVGSDFDNYLDGGGGRDTIDGGLGDDTLMTRDGAVDDVRCGAGTDTAVVDVGDIVAPDCETVQRPALVASPVVPSPALIPQPDRTRPSLSIIAPKHPALRSLIARGLTVDFACSEGCAISAELHVGRAVARSLGLRVPKAAKTLVVGRGSAARITAGRGKVMLTLTAKARKAMRKLRHGQLTLRVTATDAAANASTTTSSIRPKVAR